MVRIVVLFLIALVVLITVVVIAVKATIRSIEGKIPVPRSSERTIEERVRAEVQEETETRRAELRRDRERLAWDRRQFRMQVESLSSTPIAVDAVQQDALTQAINTIGQVIDRIPGSDQYQIRPGVEMRVTHTVETTTTPITQPRQKNPEPKPATPHRKSRYERDPVI